MNYGEIKKCDIANGEGVRVSLFVSGCTHHCKGCFNEKTWDFGFGRPFDEAAQQQILDALALPYVAGFTLLGGEPMEPANQRALLPFVRHIRSVLPQKTIWCYSGYRLEELQPSGRAYCEATDELLSLLDILVDGEFHEAEKDIRLKFRGSANQRILDMPATLQSGAPVLCARLID